MTQNAGKGYVVASVGEAAGEIPYTAYFAKKSYIEQNGDTVQAFTDAIYKGQVWVKEHSAKEIAEVIKGFFPDTDVELLANVIQSYIDIDAWNDTPVLKQESFERLQTVMEEAGELKQKAPYEKIVNNDFARKSIENSIKQLTNVTKVIIMENTKNFYKFYASLGKSFLVKLLLEKEDWRHESNSG